MQLHQLQPITKLRSKKRIGRGGKRGSYSGRGMKGQKARAGHRIRPAERDLIQRLPKLRGFDNKPLKPAAIAINLKQLEAKTKGDIINKKALIESGLIRKSDKRIKILSEGVITRPLKIQGLAVSKKAKEKIEAAGGKINE